MGKLSNKVTIVTGGASGIGEETSRLFAKEGATVIVADFNVNKAVEVAESIVNNGGKALGLKVDVANKTSVELFVKKVIDTYGKIDVLVNNAGITRDSVLWKMEEDDFDDVIAVNLKGVYNMTRTIAPHMREKEYGSIINASSIVGKFGNVGQTNYSATKGAVITMTQTWAKELGRKNIRVNATCAGFIATDMTKAMPPEILDSMKEKVSMQRLGLPIEVAKLNLFLACEDSSYINGSIISIDGGLTI